MALNCFLGNRLSEYENLTPLDRSISVIICFRVFPDVLMSVSMPRMSFCEKPKPAISIKTAVSKNFVIGIGGAL